MASGGEVMNHEKAIRLYIVGMIALLVVAAAIIAYVELR